MKINTIIGARPQFIKAAPVSKVIHSEYSERMQEIIIHTGQHYDSCLSDIFFKELGLPDPAYHLGIGSGLHGFQTGRMIEEIEKVLIKEVPDIVMIYGDTNSTLSGALAASKLHIPTAHIESGLRSYNKRMPEEINRIVADHLSTFLFCPTETAIKNLKKEGITKGVINTGDVMYDAILLYLTLGENRSSSILSDLKIREYYLATIHRAENTNNLKRLQNIFEALVKISNTLPVVLPIHPRTKKALKNISFDHSGLIIIEPVSYLDMLLLEKNANAIFTDSGGIQKEAYFLKVPCITLRDETEWVETVESGWNMLAGAAKDEIIKCVEKISEIKPLKTKKDLFGDGKASEKIINAIMN